jgi:hypothetical protein
MLANSGDDTAKEIKDSCWHMIAAISMPVDLIITFNSDDGDIFVDAIPHNMRYLNKGE